MAKIAMTKLGLSKNTDIKIVEFNNQNIEVKQYLPMEDKLNLISDIVNSSLDENNFYNPCRIHIFEIINIIMAYTNISFTEKQKEDVLKLYDLLVSSGLAEKIFKAIPADEYNFIIDSTMETIESIYAYNNSVMGILDNVSNDYENLKLDVSELQGEMADENNLGFLREVMKQLG